MGRSEGFPGLKEADMEEQKEGEAQEGCCEKSKCCGGKGLFALAALVLGGVGAYLFKKKRDANQGKD